MVADHQRTGPPLLEALLFPQEVVKGTGQVQGCIPPRGFASLDKAMRMTLPLILTVVTAATSFDRVPENPFLKGVNIIISHKEMIPLATLPDTRFPNCKGRPSPSGPRGAV